jgi:DHA2 family multidrug resistance protein
LGLVAVGLGFLQLVLDKGQRMDWFDSRFITCTALISALALIGAFIWEMREKEPVIDLHLLKDKNFSIANVLMFALGFVLYGSTMLLPLFLQSLMGYTAMQSGMAISPGGLVTMLMLPLVGMLVARVQARWLVVFGLVVVSYSLFRMTRFSMDIDFGTAVEARMVQAAGLAFLFVPINSIAYHFLPKEKNNAASGLINLSRNLGGSFGIAFVTTMLARRTQFHQSMLASHLTPDHESVRTMLERTTHYLTMRGVNPVEAAQQAHGLLYGMLGRQSAVMAYVDDFWIMAIGILAMVPLLFLMKKIQPHKGAVAAH